MEQRTLEDPEAEPAATDLNAESNERLSVEVVDDLTLASIGALRASALADLSGFTAAHTMKMSDGRRVHEQVQQLTVLADGRVWTEDEAGSWSSIDPDSGVHRGAYLSNGSGEGSYQVLHDRTGFTVGGIGLAMKGGIDPTDPVPPWDDNSVTITSSTHDGRPAWTIFSREDSAQFDTRFERTMVIDVETGLTVADRTAKWEDGLDGEAYRFESTLTDLGNSAALPADFPREFPDDALVDDQAGFDLSNGFRNVTLEEAAGAFGPGLVAPSELPRGTIAQIYDHGLDNPGSNHPPEYEEVRIVTRRGFDTTIITVTKFLPVDGITHTVGGVQCYDVDQTGDCDLYGDVSVVGAGVLAGRSVGTGAVGSVPALTVVDAGRIIRIIDPSADRARRTAETFIAI